MSVIFANPAGWWALLALPAILAIHLFQRKTQPTVITTLFLLEAMPRPDEAGRQRQRLRSSLPLWLQLLTALGITLLLVEPRLMKSEQVQRLVVLLDDSASMSVFQKEAQDALSQNIQQISRPDVKMEYSLLTSGTAAQTLYRGDEKNALLAAMRLWQPAQGSHDPSPALRVARSLAGSEGSVIFLTDHLPTGELPFRAQALAVGAPLDQQIGWASGQATTALGKNRWSVIVRNYSNQRATREWWIEAAGQKMPVQTVELGALQSRTLNGLFPADVNEVTFVLAADRFTLDDRLPLLVAQPKILRAAVEVPTDLDAQPYRDFISTFDHVRLISNASEADLVIQVAEPGVPLPERAALFFQIPPAAEAKLRVGNIVSENHPWTEGLQWGGLLAYEGPSSAPAEAQTLVWQKDQPLITSAPSRRQQPQLFCHFDLEKSNAVRLPALAVMTYRFIEEVRKNLITPEKQNVDTAQRLDLAFDRTEKAAPLTLTMGEKSATPSAAELSALRAPLQPGFFEVKQGESLIFRGAAQFADAREADFSAAARSPDVTLASQSFLARLQTEEAPWREWVIGLLALMIIIWWWIARRQSATEATNGGLLPS
jgi:hypothetical protein